MTGTISTREHPGGAASDSSTHRTKDPSRFSMVGKRLGADVGPKGRIRYLFDFTQCTTVNTHKDCGVVRSFTIAVSQVAGSRLTGNDRRSHQFLSGQGRANDSTVRFTPSWRSMDDSRLYVLREILRKAETLERDPGMSTVYLWLSERGEHAANNTEEMVMLGEGAVLDRFNAALGSHRGVRFLSCHGGFAGLGEQGREGLERLFSTILPSHPTLEEISFKGFVPARLPKLLLRALVTRDETLLSAAPTLRRLAFAGPISSFVEDLGAMLRRNAPMFKLVIEDSEVLALECQLLCDALPTNTHLHTLQIYFTGFDVRPSTFRNALGASSPLRRFDSGTSPKQWSLESFLAAMEALRTNTTLKDVNLTGPVTHHVPGLGAFELTPFLPYVETLLLRHNYTLRRIDGFDQTWPIRERLRENARVREAVSGLQQTQFRLSPRASWPDALGRISSKPALVYKFLREGNCDDLALHLSGDEGRGEP